MMTEKKKARSMTFAVPPQIAEQIVSISKQLGMQQSIVKAWVAEIAFDGLNVRTTVENGITRRLAEDKKPASVQ